MGENFFSSDDFTTQQLLLLRNPFSRLIVVDLRWESRLDPLPGAQVKMRGRHKN